MELGKIAFLGSSAGGRSYLEKIKFLTLKFWLSIVLISLTSNYEPPHTFRSEVILIKKWPYTGSHLKIPEF